MSSEVFKNKIRLRVSGILEKDGKILLAQLKSPVTDELVWMPPGGGVEFGEPMKISLRREFREETGLKIETGNLIFINELVKPPFHAVENYFEVRQTGGKLQLGKDPELDEDEQLLRDLQWFPLNNIHELNTAPQQLKSWLNNRSGREYLNFYSETYQ